MAGSGQGTPISSQGSGMSMGDLKKYSRFLLNKYDQSALLDRGQIRFSLEDALFDGYKRVARELKCLRADYTIDSVADTHTYAQSLWGGGAGARIFEVTAVFWDEIHLTQTTIAKLDRLDRRWRFRNSGSPRYWLNWSDGVIRVFPAPSAVKDFYIEGFELPEPGELNSDDDIPRIQAVDQPLIAVWGAMLYSIGTPEENSLRASSFWPLWESGINKAKTRAQDSGIIEVGGNVDLPSGGFLPPIDSIDSYTL